MITKLEGFNINLSNIKINKKAPKKHCLSLIRIKKYFVTIIILHLWSYKPDIPM